MSLTYFWRIDLSLYLLLTNYRLTHYYRAIVVSIMLPFDRETNAVRRTARRI